MGWDLVRCIYDESEQRKVVQKIIEHYAAKLFSGRRYVSAEAFGEAIGRESWNCVHQIGRVSPQLKHPSFKEEAEWRLVSPLEDLSELRHRFRPGRMSIIPYTEFDLAEDESPPTAGLSVVIGPGPEQEISGNTVMWLVSKRWPGSSVTYTNNAYHG